MIEKKEILGVSITNAPMKSVLEHVLELLSDSSKKFYIVTPNPEMVVFAHKNTDFKAVLNNASVALCDGVGLFFAYKLMNNPLKERITGVDFMLEVCKESVRKGVSIGLLGAQEGVAEETAKCLQEKYPELSITFVHDEWGEKGFQNAERLLREKNVTRSREIIGENTAGNKSHIDMLFVAYGFPKQEEWIADNLAHLPITGAMGVGGAFDFISGRVGRAPVLLQRIGLEWLYRLIRQPWRIKRQLALIEFILLVMNEKFKKNK